MRADDRAGPSSLASGATTPQRRLKDFELRVSERRHASQRRGGVGARSARGRCRAERPRVRPTALERGRRPGPRAPEATRRRLTAPGADGGSTSQPSSGRIAVLRVGMGAPGQLPPRRAPRPAQLLHAGLGRGVGVADDRLQEVEVVARASAALAARRRRRPRAGPSSTRAAPAGPGRRSSRAAAASIRAGLVEVEPSACHDAVRASWSKRPSAFINRRWRGGAVHGRDAVDEVDGARRRPRLEGASRPGWPTSAADGRRGVRRRRAGAAAAGDCSTTAGGWAATALASAALWRDHGAGESGSETLQQRPASIDVATWWFHRSSVKFGHSTTAAA